MALNFHTNETILMMWYVVTIQVLSSKYNLQKNNNYYNKNKAWLDVVVMIKQLLVFVLSCCGEHHMAPSRLIVLYWLPKYRICQLMHVLVQIP